MKSTSISLIWIVLEKDAPCIFYGINMKNYRLSVDKEGWWEKRLGCSRWMNVPRRRVRCPYL